MNIEEILNHFKYPQYGFPREALDEALWQQEVITPYLLSILENVVTDYESIDLDRMDYIFSLYLLSKFREKKAFPYIIALASLPDEWPETLLGDCITESLPRFIVSTFDDDLSSIKKLIENPTRNEWSRNAGLNSLLGLVALDKLQREELVDYLRSLFHSSLADDEEFVTHLVDTATNIYPGELMEEINAAFEKNNIDPFFINKEWIEEILAKGKAQCLAEYVYNRHFHLPIDDVEKSMSWMSAFETKKVDNYAESKDNIWENNDEDSIFETSEPYIRQSPKIGRNDPCYCGSGKKFKKCCLN